MFDGPVQEISLATAMEVVVSDMVPLSTRTCCACKEPALNVFWAGLINLSLLALCLQEASHYLPGDKAPEAFHQLPGDKRWSKGYSFSRPLTRTEWDILRSYTRRIRCTLGFRFGLDEKSIGILSNDFYCHR
ncbi:hypothetical protein EV363DRAFT_694712 [Boletus edulis]|nr:hypothetical protein EV363DRAFT_694712 [Boletus edulis]